MHKILCLLMMMGTASLGTSCSKVAPTSALIAAVNVPTIEMTKPDTTEASQGNKGDDDDDPIVPIPTSNPKK